MSSVYSLNLSSGGVPKIPVDQVMVNLNGLDGDSHNDIKYHGGINRAVCLYSLELINDLKYEIYSHPFYFISFKNIYIIYYKYLFLKLRLKLVN